MRNMNRDMEWIFKKEKAVLAEAEKKLLQADASPEAILDSYNKLVNEYRELVKQNMRLVFLGDTEQKYLFRIQNELKSILDNTGQGIFTTDKNLYIDSKYSIECIRIFEQQPDNRKLTELLRPYNSEENIELMEQILYSPVLWEDESRRDAMLLLLPREVYFRGKSLSMECKIIYRENNKNEESRFLFLLTDITDKKRLEDQMLEKQRLINAIIKIVSDNYLFKSCARAFRDFLASERVRRFRSRHTWSREELREVFRQIHTFRGDFSMFELEEVVCCLNDVEQRLDGLLAADRLPEEEELESLLGMERLREVFEKISAV